MRKRRSPHFPEPFTIYKKVIKAVRYQALCFMPFSRLLRDSPISSKKIATHFAAGFANGGVHDHVPKLDSSAGFDLHRHRAAAPEGDSPSNIGRGTQRKATS